MDDGPDGKRYIVMLKHGILGLLNYHDMTGYEIMEVFRDSLQFSGMPKPARFTGNCGDWSRKGG